MCIVMVTSNLTSAVLAGRSQAQAIKVSDAVASDEDTTAAVTSELSKKDTCPESEVRPTICTSLSLRVVLPSLVAHVRAG